MKLRLPERARQRLTDPLWRTQNLYLIEAANGKRIYPKWTPEQLTVLRTLETSRKTLILKARQLGITTATCVWLADRAIFRPEAYNTIQLGHEGDAVSRMNQMIRVAVDGLPQQLRPGMKPDTSEMIGLSHNGSLFKQSMAGGRSQGRSYTFRAFHATEVGYWPQGSSARSGKRVDEDTWGSVNSTIHEHPDNRIMVESTADGPMGLFHRLCLTAQESDQWAFHFFPWQDFPSYRIKAMPDFEPTTEEEKLIEKFGLDFDQLVWRRNKIEDIGIQVFRREYPMTPAEPFLVAEGMWFDQEKLNDMQAFLPKERLSPKKGWQWFVPPEFGRKYVGGADSAGGVGRDGASADIFRDDGLQVASYWSDRASPDELAHEIAKANIKYGGLKWNVEANKYGKRVIAVLARLGVKVWRDEKGKPWWSNPSTKAALYTYARTRLDEGTVFFENPLTIAEMLLIREQENGNIEAPKGYHDDRSDSACLAIWQLRYVRRDSVEKSVRDEIHRQRKRVLGELR